jgi:hypothetical protein
MRKTTVIIVTCLIAVMAGLVVWDFASATIAPRLTFEQATGFSLPPDTRLLHNYGNRNERLMVWQVTPEFLTTLTGPPKRSRRGNHLSIVTPSAWQPFSLGYFGRLQEHDYPNAEFIFYATDFWDVALGRDYKQGLLIGSLIYTN